MDKIKLVDAIAHLRKEIQTANAVAQKETLRLHIEDIEVDFSVEIERQVEGDAEFSFTIPLISAGVSAGGTRKDNNTHSVRLRLRPMIVGPDGKETGNVPIGRQGAREGA